MWSKLIYSPQSIVLISQILVRALLNLQYDAAASGDEKLSNDIRMLEMESHALIKTMMSRIMREHIRKTRVSDSHGAATLLALFEV